MAAPTVIGVVLAAGAGSRYGGPKVLVGTWLQDRVHALRTGGCSEVVVVLGAAARSAGPLVPSGTRVVVAEHWREGIGASLRAALRAAASWDLDAADAAVAVMVVLVDTPGLTAAAVSRMLSAVGGPDTLARAGYSGEPGHPVVIGRCHWDGLAAAALGDSGGRRYLVAHEAAVVECADLADGHDVDVRSAEDRVEDPVRIRPGR